MTPFARLALLACTTLYALALALIWRYLGWPVTGAVILVGNAVALVVTLELRPRGSDSASSVEGAKPEERSRRPLLGRDRSDIERSARAARED